VSATGAYGVGTSQPFDTVTLAYDVLAWALPVPYWVNSWHILVSIVGLLAVVVGSGLRGDWRRLEVPDKMEYPVLVIVLLSAWLWRPLLRLVRPEKEETAQAILAASIGVTIGLTITLVALVAGVG